MINHWKSYTKSIVLIVSLLQAMIIEGANFANNSHYIQTKPFASLGIPEHLFKGMPVRNQKQNTFVNGKDRRRCIKKLYLPLRLNKKENITDSIVELFMTFGGDPYKGTGTVIGIHKGKYCILTAAHNLEIYSKIFEEKLQAENVYFTFLGKQDKYQCTNYFIHATYDPENQIGKDIALLVSCTCKMTFPPVLPLLQFIQKGKYTGYVIGYPGEEEKRGELWGMKGDVIVNKKDEIIYTIDTTGGQSGSPILCLVNDVWYLVGIHTSSRIDCNYGVKITKKILDWVLFNSNIVKKEKELTEKTFKQLQRAQEMEIKMDYITKQGLSMYIPLQATNRLTDDLQDQVNVYPFTDYIAAFTGQPLADQDKDDVKDDEKKDDTGDDISDSVNKKGRIPQKLGKRLADSRILLLQGASGVGKSLSGRYITTQYQLQQFNKNKKTQWVAVFISLPNTYNGAELLNQALLKKGLNVSMIYALQQSKRVRILFILDGFDEMIKAYQSYADLPDKVCERFGFDQWKYSKFMISFRSEAITDQDKSQYLGAHPAIHLIPFSRQQSKRYIAAFAQNKGLNIAGWSTEQYSQALYRYPEFTDMTCAPFSLGLILNVLPYLYYEKGSTNISRVQLYEVFTDQWFQRQIRKLKENEKINVPSASLKQTFQAYCEELALTMFKNRQQVVDVGKEGDIWRPFFTQENRLSLQSSPLQRVGPNRYMFIYKFYRDYFVASRFIHNLFELLQYQSQWGSYDFKSVDWNQKIYQPYFKENAAVVNFMIDRLKATTRLYNCLQKLLFDLMSYSKQNKQVAVLAVNSATLLSAAGVPLPSQYQALVQDKQKEACILM